jgi:hypothetical protein
MHHAVSCGWRYKRPKLVRAAAESLNKVAAVVNGATKSLWQHGRADCEERRIHCHRW